MNTYRVRGTIDSAYDFVNADLYWVDDNNQLNFFNLSEEGDEVNVATFDPWISVVMMDEVDIFEAAIGEDG